MQIKVIKGTKCLQASSQNPLPPPPLTITCINITFPPKAGLTEAKMQLCLLAGEQTTDTSHQVLELLICKSKVHYERKPLVSLNTASNYAKQKKSLWHILPCSLKITLLLPKSQKFCFQQPETSLFSSAACFPPPSVLSNKFDCTQRKLLLGGGELCNPHCKGRGGE